MPPPEPFRVLTVCHANVCRSPVMERLLSARLPGAAVRSAGVRAVVGSDMHPLSRQYLIALGHAGDNFRARQLTGDLVTQADLVLTAETTLRGRVLEEAPAALRRTFTLLEFAYLAGQAPAGAPHRIIEWSAAHRSLAVGQALDIADPIGGSMETHAHVARQIQEAVNEVAAALQRDIGA